MVTADEILAAASQRHRTVYVCPDGDLLSRYQAKQEEYDLLSKKQGGTLGDDDDLSDLRAEVDRLAGEVNARIYELTFTEVRPGRVAEVRADHALSREEQRKQGTQIDTDGFLTQLACESITEPAFTQEQMRTLLGANEATRRQILQAVDALHGGERDPKALLPTGPHRNGDSS